MNCDKCTHKGICKNEEIARAAEEKFNNFKKENDIPGWLVFSIYCKTFDHRYGKKEDGIQMKPEV